MTTTESPSHYKHLEKMEVHELLTGMNHEDNNVPTAIREILPELNKLIAAIVCNMKRGGRLFYLGAGTSGRLGILDAAEIPPTYGLSPDKVIGLIAGGDTAIRKAVEKAEDNDTQAWKELTALHIEKKDVLIGLSASGKTPYVVGGLRSAQQHGIVTGAVVCNKESAVAQYADFPIEIIVGPEFVTGSTRLKAGSAQKMALNMISTCAMIKLGHVKDNKMIDMKLNSNKLINRGVNIIAEELGISRHEAKKRLEKHGSVRSTIQNTG